MLPDGAGGYYIVPNCSYTSCLDLYTGIPDNGKNIDLWNYNMRGSQRWYLISSSAKPSISGQTIPGNMQQGSSFRIRGTVSSREKITSVTVGAYDTNGRMKIGKTAQTNAKAYNLKNLDTSIKFGSELFLMVPIDWFWLRIRIMPFRLIVTEKRRGRIFFCGQIEMLLSDDLSSPIRAMVTTQLRTKVPACIFL